MKCWRRSFNIYLLSGLLAGLLVGGCGLGGMDPNKDYSALRVYLEAKPGDGTLARVGDAKIPVYVQSDPLLSEDEVESAKLVDSPDGTFSIQVKFNDDGRIKLDMESTMHRGQHLVFFCQTHPKRGPDGEAVLSKNLPWVSMLTIRTAITGGVVEFTPATSHEEAESIVRGINNLVLEINKAGK